MFDHARDSLAIMHMFITHSLKFIGPRASIPGLFFGPAWYYLLAPAYILGGGNPVTPVFIMIFLVLIQVYLAYRFFGFFEALIITSTQTWIWVSTSAWNPFPLTFLSLIILIILKQTEKAKTISIKQSLILGLTASLGFHFSTAFAIFYPPLIFISLLLQKIKIKLTNFLWALGAFIVPFIPQILFEIKNNFLELRAIINYLTWGQTSEFSIRKILDVIKLTFTTLAGGSWPQIWTPFAKINLLITLIMAVLFILVIKYNLRSKNKNNFPLLRESLIFIIVPTSCYFFLHFSSWYILGMLPAATIIIGSLIRHSPITLRKIFVVLLIISPLSFQINYFKQERRQLLEKKDFLPVKLKTLELIRQQAKNKPFSSYHYLPEVYDYPYQYLYFWQAIQGKPFPIEFSYRPNEIAYLPEKQALLSHFKAVTSTKPEFIFFIVEKPEKKQLLDQWWSEQTPHSIINKWQVSPELILYQTIPI
jgi:hypothetical protein